MSSSNDTTIHAVHTCAVAFKLEIRNMLEKLRNQWQVGQVHTTDTSWIHEERSLGDWNDGWRSDEWNDDWSCVGWHEDCEQTHTHL